MKDGESLKAIELKEKIKSRETIDRLFDDTESYESDDEKKGDLNQLFLKGMSNMNLKIAFLLFFVYIILNSEIFMDNVLGAIHGTIKDNQTTNKGVIISGMFLAISYILIDMIFD